MATLPPLQVIGAAQWQSTASDELVVRRVLELEAAEALGAVREAIEADDWQKAEQLASDAAVRFAPHEWAAAVLASIRRLIGERDKRLSSKEAAYARRLMNMRLSARNEPKFSAADEDSIPAFLRRKPEQGKGQRDS